MTSEDRLRPYHAKEEARGQEAADTVAAVLRHAQEREEAARGRPAPKKQPRWMLPLGINLMVFAVYLLIAPPQWATVRPIEGPDAASREVGMRVAMVLQAQRIEAYRQTNGRLPETLAEMQASAVDGVEYRREGGAFLLVGTVEDAVITYDSRAPDEAFARSLAERLAGAGG